MLKKQKRIREDRPVDIAIRNKRQLRHLEELENDNFRHRSEIEQEKNDDTNQVKTKKRFKALDDENEGNRKRTKKELKRALQKKTLKMILEECNYESYPDYIPTYWNIAVEPSHKPPRHFCSICGYISSSQCIKCGMRYCSLKCCNTHQETRCMKYIA